nr:hypothetical protein [Bacillus dakarensis]
MIAGGLIGLTIIRFATNLFVKLHHSRPGLETTAFVIVGWVEVRLVVLTLGHPGIVFGHYSLCKIALSST